MVLYILCIDIIGALHVSAKGCTIPSVGLACLMSCSVSGYTGKYVAWRMQDTYLDSTIADGFLSESATVTTLKVQLNDRQSEINVTAWMNGRTFMTSLYFSNTIQSDLGGYECSFIPVTLKGSMRMELVHDDNVSDVYDDFSTTSPMAMFSSQNSYVESPVMSSRASHGTAGLLVVLVMAICVVLFLITWVSHSIVTRTDCGFSWVVETCQIGRRIRALITPCAEGGTGASVDTTEGDDDAESVDGRRSGPRFGLRLLLRSGGKSRGEESEVDAEGAPVGCLSSCARGRPVRRGMG